MYHDAQYGQINFSNVSIVMITSTIKIIEIGCNVVLFAFLFDTHDHLSLYRVLIVAFNYNKGLLTFMIPKRKYKKLIDLNKEF